MSIRSNKALKYSDGEFRVVEDNLTAEEILRISINGKPFSITMRTPGFEDELVRGILFSEGVYTDLEWDPENYVTSRNACSYITAVNVSLPEELLKTRIEGARSLPSVASCGLCGKTELDTEQPLPALQHSLKLPPLLIEKMFSEMRNHQSDFELSGGAHAAAAFSIEGNLLEVKEDIGRHNAFDKMIGSLILKRRLSAAQIATVSGRISYEIVSKCYLAGIPFLAAVSAPSSMAVEYCEKLGITLLGFCRGANFTVYSGSKNIDTGR